MVGLVSLQVEKQYFTILPATQKSVVTVSCTTVPIVVDLTSIPPSAAATAVNATTGTAGDPGQKNLVGKYVRITADAGNVYYAASNNYAALGTTNANAVSTVNATTGAVTVTGNEMDLIPQGSFKDVLVMPDATPTTELPPGSGSPNRYVALATSTGTAVARMYQRST